MSDKPHVTCPRCGQRHELLAAVHAAVQDQTVRDTVQAAMQLPSVVSDQVFRYMRLFDGQRGISWPVYSRLLSDLVHSIRSEQITRNRRTVRAPIKVWVSALNSVLSAETLTLPLKTHGYLYTIVQDAADRLAAQGEPAATVAAIPHADAPARQTRDGVRRGLQSLADALATPRPDSGRQ